MMFEIRLHLTSCTVVLVSSVTRSSWGHTPWWCHNDHQRRRPSKGGPILLELLDPMGSMGLRLGNETGLEAVDMGIGLCRTPQVDQWYHLNHLEILSKNKSLEINGRYNYISVNLVEMRLLSRSNYSFQCFWARNWSVLYTYISGFIIHVSLALLNTAYQLLMSHQKEFHSISVWKL